MYCRPRKRSSSKIKPRYMRGVCVYHLNRCKTSHWFFTNLQGDVSRTYQGPRPTKLPDMILGYHQPDQPGDVPAVRSFFRTSKGPSLEPQQQCYTICCTVVAIWNQCWSFTISSAASEPSSVFSPNHVADSIFDFLGIFRRNHVADVFGLFCQNYVADI